MSETLNALEKLTSASLQYGSKSQEYFTAAQEFKPMLSYYQKLFGYDNIIFVSPADKVIFSSAEVKDFALLYGMVANSKSGLFNLLARAKVSQEPQVSHLDYYPQAKKVACFVATPIFEGPEFKGSIMVEIGNQGINEFVQDYTGLGQTGETIVVSNIGKKAIFITPIRFDAEAVFKRKIEIGSNEGLDIQKAIKEGKVTGITFDYRDKEVLAVWRYLPDFNLGIIVKMDTEEVFASAKKLRYNLFRISFVLIAMVVLLAFLIAKSVSSPITELTQVSRIISGGNLAARAKVNTKDEIGELAASFNQMTDNLVEAKNNLEQKKTELEEQKKLLEAANKELDSFVYTVSHDLRAPLRGIDGLAKFLEDDYVDKLDKQGQDYLSKIRSGATHMKELIDDLLTLSRISRIKNPHENVDIKELINSVISRIEFDIKEHKVELNLPEKLPVVRCDKIKMAEVFLNLINNAIKFSSKIQDTPKVQIGYNDRKDAHEFYVKDNGIGIDKKYHEEIFGIFKRLHKQEEYEGTGAGLSIVKKIIDDHKGSIWVDSELGKGTTFYFTIPKEIPKAKKLGELLIEAGFVSEKDVKITLKKQGIDVDINQI
jgi:signal transduction histidine kinase